MHPRTVLIHLTFFFINNIITPIHAFALRLFLSIRLLMQIIYLFNTSRNETSDACQIICFRISLQICYNLALLFFSER